MEEKPKSIAYNPGNDMTGERKSIYMHALRKGITLGKDLDAQVATFAKT